MHFITIYINIYHTLIDSIKISTISDVSTIKTNLFETSATYCMIKGKNYATENDNNTCKEGKMVKSECSIHITILYKQKAKLGA